MKIKCSTKWIAAVVTAAAVAAPTAQGGAPGASWYPKDLNLAYPPLKAASVYPQLQTGEGFSFKAPAGWPIVNQSSYPRLETGEGFSFKAPAGWRAATVRPVGVSGSDGFDYGDAGIGAGIAGAIALLLAAGMLGAHRRRRLAQL